MGKVIRLTNETEEIIKKTRKMYLEIYEEDLRSMKLIKNLSDNDIIQMACEDRIQIHKERRKNSEQKQ